MTLEEGDSEKHDKILSLKLKPSEWERAGLFLGLLAVCALCSVLFYYQCILEQHADNAQQAFSLDQISTLHFGIPALEALYKAWLSRIDKPKYAPFVEALQAACATVDKYYEKTTITDAYILAMGKRLSWHLSVIDLSLCST
jgi:hypothetical protein